jgi:hypothetical protein
MQACDLQYTTSPPGATETPSYHTMPTTLDLRLEAYIIRALTSTNVVFQYDPETDELVVWGWWVIDRATHVHSGSPGYAVARPIEDENRVPPSGMRDHRVTNKMPNPICFCSMKFRNVNQPKFVEAAIYLITTGLYGGQYVASCANDRCGYFGESSLRSDWTLTFYW